MKHTFFDCLKCTGVYKSVMVCKECVHIKTDEVNGKRGGENRNGGGRVHSGNENVCRGWSKIKLETCGTTGKWKYFY